MNAFNILGMTCESCTAKIRAAFEKAGYTGVSVTLSPPMLRFDEGDTSMEAIQRTLAQAGTSYTLADPMHARHTRDQEKQPEHEQSLRPLFVVLAYILGAVFLRAHLSNNFQLLPMMDNFMGAFLVVFSLFKLINLKGFADAYATYDLVASRSRVYALAYPFIELVLGVAYFVGFLPLATNAATFVLMLVGSLGVFKALRSNRKFQCACLGTALKLPMTKVTLVEDLLMALMAMAMLLHEMLLLL